MRTKIDEPNSLRFSVSRDTDLPIVDENLFLAPDSSISNITENSTYVLVSGLTHDDNSETFQYNITFSPFTITQLSNGIETLSVNKNGSF